MPENLKALAVIIFLATIVFTFAGRYVCATTQYEDFTRRRNLWFMLTIAAFLAHNFLLYTLIAIPLVIFANRREHSAPSLYFFLVFVLPSAHFLIPGMGGINYFLDLTYQRLLTLIILLPAFFALRRQSDITSFGRSGTDKLLIAYLLLNVVIYFFNTTLTDSLRNDFYLLIDIFLPYFVISRSLKNLPAFRDALLSLVLAIMVLAPLAVFESMKHWLLYSVVTRELGFEQQSMTEYLMRDGIIRAIATAGQPIALGYLMVVGMGLYIFLQHSIEHKLIRRLGMSLLAAGLISSLSRGPWIGALVLFVAYIATGRYAIRRIMSLALMAMLVLPLLSILPRGERAINLLPFIGTTEKETIDYRERLITNSMIVIKRNPWFGSKDYLKAPEMQAMRQGQGIIDIVNSYIGLALTQGLVGLVLFVSFFALTLLGIYRAMRLIPDKDSEEYLLGRVLLATLLAILIIIFTASSITIIPIVYWSFAGMGIAYVQMVRKNTT
jgi:O-antigen ligase